jgi:hypothetical protein
MSGGYFVGSETVKVKRDWNTLHNEELLDLYPLPRIIRVITSRRVRLVGHAARMGRGEVHAEFWWGNRLEDLGRITLKWVLNK